MKHPKPKQCIHEWQNNLPIGHVEQVYPESFKCVPRLVIHAISKCCRKCHASVIVAPTIDEKIF